MTTQTTPLPVETVTPIRPSEAIRLGCLMYPVQHFGWYFNDGRTAACVLGAMHAGGSPPPADGAGEPHDCPAGCDIATLNHGRRLTSHLNDDHRWSRERIADWLESIGL